ncbi:hypothetical protein [Polyangium sp. 15x6]|uniref:hypothetical protein n=1 Tax=Polyangium sp. 15x6 TaxID=3042687 RepID=UPI002499F1B1|nr:hypothetical protein [Polyangium sp. 15x6]MDI3282525.1 hypothetical protein [Polyangium sp. 15x6]
MALRNKLLVHAAALFSGLDDLEDAVAKRLEMEQHCKSSPTTVWTTIRAHGRRHVRGTRMLAAPACARRVRRSRTITVHTIAIFTPAIGADK